MPRRPRDLTPSDTTGTPTDSRATPTEATPLPLPKPPSLPRPPRLPPPGTSPAKPGRRGEMGSDATLTSKIPRVPRGDPTPAPLPPSPGARDAEVWFEQVPTNPAAQSLGPGESTGSHRRSSKIERSGFTSAAPAKAEKQWVVMFLIAAIALTIGMIVGGLLFGRGGGTKCEPCTKSETGAAQPKQ
jgi:hypothetical protein